MLEELNVAANPLRVLPTWLSQLTSLRVFIADSTGISNLPQSMHAVTTLHTLSIRKNRMYSLPAWLSHLNALETLLVDGNPFLEPWSSLVAPILEGSNRPAPMYPPLTPTATLPLSAATPDSNSEPPLTGSSFPPTPLYENGSSSLSNPPLRRSLSQPQARRPNVESGYSTPPASRPPSSATHVARPPSPRSRSGSTSKSAINVGLPSMSNPRPRTAPIHPVPVSAPVAKAALVGSYLSMLDSTLPSSSSPTQKSFSKTSTSSDSGRKPMRRMKSADELSRFGQFSHPPTSAPLPASEEAAGRRFESLPRGGLIGSRNGERSRVPLTVWADTSGSARRDALISASDPRPTSVATSRPDSRAALLDSVAISPNEETVEKGKRWGFFKKMSMSRMRSATSPKEQQYGAASSRQGVIRAHTTAGRSTSPLPSGPPIRSPSLGMAHGLERADAVHTNSAPVVPRIAEDGMLLPPIPPSVPLNPNFPSPSALPAITVPVLEEEEPVADTRPSAPPQLELRKKSSREAMALLSPLQGTPKTPSPTLLSPMTARAQKRRSFLPLISATTTGGFDVPVPSPGPFVNQDPPKDNANESNRDSGSQYLVAPTQSSAVQEAQELEQQRIREQYKGGLRSVISYLRDLSDLSGPLGVSELGPGSTPGSPSAGQTKRRPTMTSDSRIASEGSMGSLNGSPGLSKRPSMVSLSGAAFSISTSESGGSGNIEDRKYKEDKNKRVKIINEIVV